jgi:hypothetical protein
LATVPSCSGIDRDCGNQQYRDPYLLEGGADDRGTSGSEGLLPAERDQVRARACDVHMVVRVTDADLEANLVGRAGTVSREKLPRPAHRLVLRPVIYLGVAIAVRS